MADEADRALLDRFVKGDQESFEWLFGISRPTSTAGF
jgi:hypothetical protein